MVKLAWLTIAATALCAASGFVCEARAKPPEFQYRYVSLEAAIPSGWDFFEPRAITDSGRVYGTLSNCCSSVVAVYQRGRIAVLHEGFAGTANNREIVGGGVIDPVQGTFQAALFGRRRVKRFPLLPGEWSSAVGILSESGIAFVVSFETDFSAVSYYLRRRGHVIPLDFGPDFAEQFDLNDHAVISGTSFRDGADRAFRYNARSGRMTLLEPLPSEPKAWGQGINRRGDVLGYSFADCATERVGVWRGTTFHTYFVEGTPQFPTVSNDLLWNERGLIVITSADICGNGTDLNSYLVPRPGKRLKLADLVDRPLPVWTSIIDLNVQGDMIGWGGSGPFIFGTPFLLERVDSRAKVVNSVRAAGTEVAPGRRHMRPPAAVVRALRERWEKVARKGKTTTPAALAARFPGTFP